MSDFFWGGFIQRWRPELGFRRGVTIAAWVWPTNGTAGRIANKIKPGGSDGWLLDTHPGNGLRLIVGNGTIIAPLTVIPFSPSPGAWLHIADMVDASGSVALFASGKCVTERRRNSMVFRGSGVVPWRGWSRAYDRGLKPTATVMASLRETAPAEAVRN